MYVDYVHNHKYVQRPNTQNVDQSISDGRFYYVSTLASTSFIELYNTQTRYFTSKWNPCVLSKNKTVATLVGHPERYWYRNRVVLLLFYLIRLRLIHIALQQARAHAQ